MQFLGSLCLSLISTFYLANMLMYSDLIQLSFIHKGPQCSYVAKQVAYKNICENKLNVRGYIVYAPSQLTGLPQQEFQDASKP